jgi:hypothetical protein
MKLVLVWIALVLAVSFFVVSMSYQNVYCWILGHFIATELDSIPRPSGGAIWFKHAICRRRFCDWEWYEHLPETGVSQKVISRFVGPCLGDYLGDGSFNVGLGIGVFPTNQTGSYNVLIGDEDEIEELGGEE